MNFENKLFEGIHYSRFVASWVRSGGKRFNRKFEEWLSTLVINDKKIPEDVIHEIRDFGSNGKLELEESAKRFLTTE